MSARCKLSNITLYGRILRKESVDIQKVIFTKWANAFLKKAHLEIKDLFTDLADGKMLMKLLESISGESIGIPNEGVLRAQKLDNLNRCFQFLRKKIHFENIGEEDICDGNNQLILGLIWTIILRFQIQEIEIEVDEEDEGGEKIYAKDALLLWCKRKTVGYRGVNITNFTTSWRDGLGFNALIHAHRPDIIYYADLIPSENIKNLNNAFNVAEEKLGIYKMFDAEDVNVHRPDEQVIITYVASYYHYFVKKKTENTGETRIAQDVDICSETTDADTSQVLQSVNYDSDTHSDCPMEDIDIFSQDTYADKSQVLQSGNSDPDTHSDCPMEDADIFSQDTDADTSQALQSSDSDLEALGDCPGDIETNQYKKRRSWFDFFKMKKDKDKLKEHDKDKEHGKHKEKEHKKHKKEKSKF